jgi:cellulose synthase/poly-beta-1,6-N-acetylglucosamine synthase-like glycosyltransferase
LGIFHGIFITFAALYAIIIIIFFIGIYRIKTSTNNFKPFVSVLVPARNEEQKIIECLRSLNQQSYPTNQFEVIVIDDHSIDNKIRKIPGDG